MAVRPCRRSSDAGTRCFDARLPNGLSQLPCLPLRQHLFPDGGDLGCLEKGLALAVILGVAVRVETRLTLQRAPRCR